MKVSQLINDLQRVVDNDGDMNVVIDTGEGEIHRISLCVARPKIPNAAPFLIIDEAEYQGN